MALIDSIVVRYIRLDDCDVFISAVKLSTLQVIVFLISSFL